jgi:hypothetical protein
LHFEYNGAAVLAAPIIAFIMFTPSVHLVWKTYYNYWCCKKKNIEKGEVQLTFSSTTPIRLKVASIGWSERKRKKNYIKMAAKLKYKRMRSPPCRINQCCGTGTRTGTVGTITF